MDTTKIINVVVDYLQKEYNLSPEDRAELVKDLTPKIQATIHAAPAALPVKPKASRAPAANNVMMQKVSEVIHGDKEAGKHRMILSSYFYSKVPETENGKRTIPGVDLIDVSMEEIEFFLARQDQIKAELFPSKAEEKLDPKERAQLNAQIRAEWEDQHHDQKPPRPALKRIEA